MCYRHLDEESKRFNRNEFTYMKLPDVFLQADPEATYIKNRRELIPVWIQFDSFSSTSAWYQRAPSGPWGPPLSSIPHCLFLICGPPPHRHLRAFLKVWRSWRSQAPTSSIGRAWHACPAAVCTTLCLKWGGRCTCSEGVMLQGDRARLWTSTPLRYEKRETATVNVAA